MRFESLKLLFTSAALVPRFEIYEECSVPRRKHKAQQTKGHEAGRVFNTWGIHDDFLDLIRYRARAFQRCAARQLDADIGIALIFVRKEARGNTTGEEKSGRSEHPQQND